MAEPAAAAAEPFACGREEESGRRSGGSKGEMPATLATSACLIQEQKRPGSDAINKTLQPKHDQADEGQHATPSSADRHERLDVESDDDGAQVEMTLEDLLLRLKEERGEQVETRPLAADQELQALARTFSQLSFDSDRARDERWWREHESAQDSADEHLWSDDEVKSDSDNDAEVEGELRSEVVLALADTDSDVVCPPIAGSSLHNYAHADEELVLSVSELDEQVAFPESVDPCDAADPVANMSIPAEEVPGANEADSVVIGFIVTESRNNPLGGFSNLDIFGYEPLEDVSDDTCSEHEVSSASDHSSVSDSADQEVELPSSSEQMVVTSFQERTEDSQESDNQDAHHDDSADWVDVPNQVNISSSDSISSMAEKEEEPHPESPVNSPKLLRSKSFLLPVELSFEDTRLSIEEMALGSHHQSDENSSSCQANHSIGSDTLDSYRGCQLHESMGTQQLSEHLSRMTKQIVYLTKLLHDPYALNKWKALTDLDTRNDSCNLLVHTSSETTAEFSDESIANEKLPCDTCSINLSDACFRLVCERKAEISVGGNSNDDEYHEQLSRLAEHNMELKKQIADLQERERVMESEKNDLVSTIESLKLQLAKFEQPFDPAESIKDQGHPEPDTLNTLFLGHQNFEDDMNSRSTNDWMSALLKPDAERASRYNENPETLEQQREWLNSQTNADTNFKKLAFNLTSTRSTESIEVQDDVDVIQPLPFSNQNEPIQWLNLENAHTLVNHERCQERRSELVDTVKILRGYVNVYRSQRDDMKCQRDEAIVSAEKAWDQNAKLVSSTNPKQKIQYTMQMKNDNVLLHSRVRELQTKIASQVVSAPSTAILDSEQHNESAVASTSRLCVTDLDDSEDPARLVLFHRMQAFMEQREAKIQQLKKQRFALGCSQSEISPSSSSFSPAASVRRRHASLRVRS